jgi:hypothetical protein
MLGAAGSGSLRHAPQGLSLSKASRSKRSSRPNRMGCVEQLEHILIDFNF